MTILNSPLVGMHFRPPAKAVLAHLPSGSKLLLIPEPDNPYDEKAIKVLVEPGEVPESEYDALQADMDGMGFQIEDVLQLKADVKAPIHLGYIADSKGKVVQARLDKTGNAEIAAAVIGADTAWQDIRASLGFEGDGKPIVIVKLE